MESPSEEDSTPKRAPRKRVSSATAKVARKPVQKRTPRKASTARVEQADVTPPTVERKAPTMFADCQLSKRKRQRNMIVIGAILLLGIGSSAAIGFTDKGQIDVQKTIEARNERIRTNTADANDIINSRVEVPVQNTNNAGKVDGGLRGRAPGEVVEKPVPVVATTTATSSDQTASSTEATEIGTTTNAIGNTEEADDSSESDLDS